MSPFKVNKAKNCYEEWKTYSPFGCKYSVSKSGRFELLWNGVEIVIPYFSEEEGSKMGIGDNRSSHEVMKYCGENGIRFVLLPPNVTDFCQPLEVSFFV